MKIKIKIEIYDDDDSLFFTDEVESFEMAEMSLGQAERAWEADKEKREFKKELEEVE